MTRVCTKCKVEKPLEDFNKAPKGKYGRQAHCRMCHAAKMKAHNSKAEIREKNRLYAETHAKRTHERHGLSLEQYQVLLDKYDGNCWTCRTVQAQCIDHDHSCCPSTWSCGKCVRGVLCSHCNRGLGMVLDNVETLQRMIDYLDNSLGSKKTGNPA